LVASITAGLRVGDAVLAGALPMPLAAVLGVLAGLLVRPQTYQAPGDTDVRGDLLARPHDEPVADLQALDRHLLAVLEPGRLPRRARGGRGARGSTAAAVPRRTGRAAAA
jgi:hypothetical protein